MSMDEAQARRVVLAQAVETVDTQGRLLGPAARDAIDRQARQDARAFAGPPDGRFETVLAQRAARVVEAAQAVQPSVAALAQPQAWQRWLVVGLPVLTLLLGAVTDRISDPHRVDLLSQPLLAILAWNLAVYAVLLVRWCAAQGKRTSGPQAPLLATLQRWLDGLGQRRRSGPLRAEVTARFALLWHAATAALMQQRLARVLHLAAAGWGAGVALSLLARGLFVQYRVGWESTWLAAEQVHAVLGWLLMPAVALLGLEPLTVPEVAALQVHAGGGHAPDRRWVLLYACLLLVVVILPRLLLAGLAWWRETHLARHIALGLDQPYYQNLAALLIPARVQLGLQAHRSEDSAALRFILQQTPQPDLLALMVTSEGDALTLDEGDALREEADVLLHLVAQPGDLAAAAPQLQAAGAPVLLLANPVGQPGERLAFADRCRREAGGFDRVARVLAFDEFARCWVQEAVLLNALVQVVPQAQRPGMARLAKAWRERNGNRLEQSMASLALQLLEAAREAEPVRSAPLSILSVVSPAQRQSHEEARKAAMALVLERLRRSASTTFVRLARLHGVENTGAGTLEHRLVENFLVQEAVSTPQAGMAGAATGAAMGASVDLMTGGLTLGAAAALGALVGGGAAFVAAAWKNKATASGVAQVQLSEEMLQALVEAGLLRYLCVIHAGRGPVGHAADRSAQWADPVAAVVQAHRAQLLPYWSAARAEQGPPDAGAALAGLLESMAMQLLNRLYPSS